MKGIQLAAIDHVPGGEHRHALSDGRVCLGAGEGCALTAE